MVYNLHSFRRGCKSTDRQFAKEIKFKESLIDKAREDLERVGDMLTRLHKSIVNSAAVKEK